MQRAGAGGAYVQAIPAGADPLFHSSEADDVWKSAKQLSLHAPEMSSREVISRAAKGKGLKVSSEDELLMGVALDILRYGIGVKPNRVAGGRGSTGGPYNYLGREINRDK